MATARDLIGQLTESSDLSYRTRVKADSISVNNRGSDLFPDDLEATVEWEMDLEARSWGVKDINVYIKKVEASWVWEDGEKDTRSEPTKLLWTSASNDGWAVQVDHGPQKMPFTLFPREVSIYLLEKKIVVTF